MEKSDLKFLVKLHARDIILLIAVMTKTKPIASLVAPLEVEEWMKEFCLKTTSSIKRTDREILFRQELLSL